MQANLHSTKRPRWLDIAWLIALSVYIIAGAGIVPFHGDEATVIYTGRDVFYVLEGNSSYLRYYDDADSVYDSGATQQHLRLLNGPLVRYSYGLAAYLTGYSVDDINDQWVWGWDYETNVREGHFPDESLLLLTRIMSALMTAGATIALFAVAHTLTGRAGAYVASGYFALNPAVLINGRRAMMEGGMLLGAVLVVLAGLWAIKNRHIGYYILLGVLCGLAISAKHPAAFACAAVFAGIIVQTLLTEPARIVKVTAKLFVAAMIALAIFYALNPAWWGDPITRAGDVLALRTDLLTGQTATFGGYAGVGEQLAGFFKQTFVVLPMYSEADFFLPYIADQIAQYEASPLRGVSIGGSVLGGVLVIALCATGVVMLWQKKSRRWFMLTWAFVTALVILLTTPVEWQRYYLLLYPAVAVLLGGGVAFIIRAITGSVSPNQQI